MPARSARLVYARGVDFRSCVVCAVVGALSFACTTKNPEFCCSSVDSCGAVGAAGVVMCNGAGSRPFCDDLGAFGAAHTCVADPTAPVCDDTLDCTTPGRPVCDVSDTGTCMGCAVGADCARFPGLALCHPTSGACVECTGAEHCLATDQPICGSGGACRGCTADAECAAGVCDEPVGACVAEADIIYVDRATGAGTACMRLAPCLTMSAGVAAPGPRRWMVVAAGDYSETVTLDGRAMTFIGPGVSLRPAAFDMPAMLVLNASAVRLEGLRLYSAGGNANGDGVRCAAPTSGTPTLAMVGVRIDGNVGFGVDANSCAVTITASTIVGNTGGGVSISDGSFAITNTFITGNGANTAIGGVRLSANDASSVFAFNTVADNVAGGGIAEALICTSVQPQRIANNILAGSDPTQVSFTNCDFEFNLSNQGLGGSGNVTATPMFVGGTDFHLTLSSEGVDDADPSATLAVDFDGHARPQGNRRDIGADEVVP